MTAKQHALYRFYGDDGLFLYVGLTHDPGRRFGEHRHTKSWWPEVRGVGVEWYPDRESAAAAEARAIRVERPLYNIARPTLQTPGMAKRLGAAAKVFESERSRRRLTVLTLLATLLISELLLPLPIWWISPTAYTDVVEQLGTWPTFGTGFCLAWMAFLPETCKTCGHAFRMWIFRNSSEENRLCRQCRKSRRRFFRQLRRELRQATSEIQPAHAEP